MKKLVAVFLSAAITLGLPTAAQARDHSRWDGDGHQWRGDRDGDHHWRHHDRYRYSSYGYGYPSRTSSIYYSVGYPNYGYGYGSGYGYPSYGYPQYG